LIVVCGLVFINYMVRAVRVINAFTTFLGIRCLVIPHEGSKKKNVLPVTNEEAESLLVGGGNSTSTTAYNSIN
jgi:hypothetical protein